MTAVQDCNELQFVFEIGLPDRAFHNFRASKYVDQRFWTNIKFVVRRILTFKDCGMLDQVASFVPVIVLETSRDISVHILDLRVLVVSANDRWTIDLLPQCSN